ncbi:N-acetyl neuraminic (sialic) acid synthetase [Leptospira ognonensis]|uniref:N-acetyl neuraminic (Sialic) acid synthetase n=1 Tax=Leptospira ognonensis TaxID=2484945 RepID=A0A4R9JUI4_9LEPT|nr:N-acetylneuraminate synthase family protein [Leptospira ognonensis]TGL54902.1 N-acetyl neuraminic (sialic) acid synthetase [Leptospira ognonensis]
MDFTIGNKTLTRNSKPYLIAEIGLNHNNDLEIGKKTIQAAKAAGADAVKFQSYVTEDFISKTESDARFLYDIFKTYELSKTYHEEFKKVSEDEGLDFFSTPLDTASVEMLTTVGVPVLKIASGDIVNLQLLQKAMSTKLPLIVSTGAALPEEVMRAISLFKENDYPICLMHCVSLYPTPADKANLRSIPFFLDTTPYVIGFSDHTAGTLAPAIAVGLGASLIEKHFTLDKNLEGPDHGISMDPDGLKNLRSEIDLAYQMRGEFGKKTHKEETGGWYFGRRSLYKRGDEILSMRPALHTRDVDVLDAWEIGKIKSPSSIKEDGPVRKK